MVTGLNVNVDRHHGVDHRAWALYLLSSFRLDASHLETNVPVPRFGIGYHFHSISTNYWIQVSNSESGCVVVAHHGLLAVSLHTRLPALRNASEHHLVEFAVFTTSGLTRKMVHVYANVQAATKINVVQCFETGEHRSCFENC